MKYNLRFLPAIEEDIKEVFNWYENKSEALGERFSKTFYEHCSQISLNPLLYLKMYKEFRRCLMKHFPYVIYYRIVNQDVIIWGLFHSARSPRALQTVLRDRI